MKHDINNNFYEYKEEAYKGFTLKELFTMITCLVLSSAVVMFFMFVCDLSLSTALNIALPFIVFIGFLGFYKRDNRSFIKMMKRKIEIYKTPVLRVKEPDIRRIIIRERMEMENEEETKKRQK